MAGETNFNFMGNDFGGLGFGTASAGDLAFPLAAYFEIDITVNAANTLASLVLQLEDADTLSPVMVHLIEEHLYNLPLGAPGFKTLVMDLAFPNFTNTPRDGVPNFDEGERDDGAAVAVSVRRGRERRGSGCDGARDADRGSCTGRGGGCWGWRGWWRWGGGGGQVLAADHLHPHAFLSAGHKGLFFDRLDRGVSDSTAVGTATAPGGTVAETPGLVPFARGVYQVRNRSILPGGGIEQLAVTDPPEPHCVIR
jgi:hypothetical protein